MKPREQAATQSPSRRSTKRSSANGLHPNCCIAKARVDLPDPDLPQNANTPPGPAVAPAWSTCPQPRACKISGCNIRENALTTVSRDAFASGQTRTPCSPTEKTNTPTPGQAIQCKFSHENARPHTLPQSSIHLLTSRPVEGGGVSPPINVSVSNPVSAATGMPQILLNRSRHRRVSCYAAS